MLWEVEIQANADERDRAAEQVLADARGIDAGSIREARTARSFLLQGDLNRDDVARAANDLLVDPVVEHCEITEIRAHTNGEAASNRRLLNVLFKPGVTDNVASSARNALTGLGYSVGTVATCRKYWLNGDAEENDVERMIAKVLANEAIERVVDGPLAMESIALGSPYDFELNTVAIREMSDEELVEQSRVGQLYLSLVEMQTIQKHFIEQERDPTDIELETVAQTWSEHCSHKTLAGRIHYREAGSPLNDDSESAPRDIRFENMLKETIFAATVKIREQLGEDDWCVSVFKDNAGIVTFDETDNVCFKVETHNHPSALEPYGGANTGIGGVIRDPLGTGLGAKPVCNTDVFCFAPPDTPQESLPPGVLHPKTVAKGVVSGVRDYGNRMGIPTVNGAVFFDERYLGNPLVYCGNVAMIPIDKCEKRLQPGDRIVAVGGRTGRDGIHGATFSSAELNDESEMLSGGAVQIGNAVTEKMVADVILEARDRGLYSSITDCGAGGFSSAVGEMGEETGAEVWLERAPLKYAGLSYTEIWISEAQERMVLSVPPDKWDALHALCESEGVEATVIGKFTDTKRLVLKYDGKQVGDLSMSFLHDGRPPIVRDAVYDLTSHERLDCASRANRLPPLTKGGPGGGTAEPLEATAPNPPLPRGGNADVGAAGGSTFDTELREILGSLNVCSKEWIIRQYDHEVQAGSVVKPLVGVANDGPSDAAVIRPTLTSNRGLVISNGMNPRFGDLDPYWMAASAIDEAMRNCVAVGADPKRIAILDNFCWGNTEKPETLGSLVRAAIACHDVAIAFGTPFISGKDSLYNEFSFDDADGNRQTVAIPSSLLISALGQIDDITTAVTMDFKQPGNLLYQIGETKDELGGSHFSAVSGQQPAVSSETAPRVNLSRAPQIFSAVHRAISQGAMRSCHDLSEGGLAAAIAEMAFAGGFGAEVSLSAIPESTQLSDSVLLFSESNTRFVAEVEPGMQAEFEACFDGLPLTQIGTVVDSDHVRFVNAAGDAVIDSKWGELKTAWQTPMQWD